MTTVERVMCGCALSAACIGGGIVVAEILDPPRVVVHDPRGSEALRVARDSARLALAEAKAKAKANERHDAAALADSLFALRTATAGDLRRRLAEQRRHLLDSLEASGDDTAGLSDPTPSGASVGEIRAQSAELEAERFRSRRCRDTLSVARADAVVLRADSSVVAASVDSLKREIPSTMTRITRGAVVAAVAFAIGLLAGKL